MYLDIWECGDYLVLGRELCALLELEVANGARQGKIAIDSAEVNETSCSLNACFLGYDV
jgi:hypothetical protein